MYKFGDSPRIQIYVCARPTECEVPQTFKFKFRPQGRVRNLYLEAIALGSQKSLRS